MNEKIIDAGFFIDDDDGVRCEGNAFLSLTGDELYILKSGAEIARWKKE